MANRKDKQKALTIKRQPEPPRFRYAIITSRFNEDVTRPMHAAAKATLEQHRAESIDEIWVPGAWELPFAAQVLAETCRYDALVALGCVIRGETTHHEHIGRETSAGLMRVSLEQQIPIGFGLLTTDTLAQAQARAGGDQGNKGVDAAMAAIELAELDSRFTLDESDEFDDFDHVF